MDQTIPIQEWQRKEHAHQATLQNWHDLKPKTLSQMAYFATVVAIAGSAALSTSSERYAPYASYAFVELPTGEILRGVKQNTYISFYGTVLSHQCELLCKSAG